MPRNEGHQTMRWYAGTSGYSYAPWSGPFYPAELKPADFLAYYASRLPAVEINNTFYRMPKKHVLESWHDSVPSEFRFVIKASQRITHQAKLADCQENVNFLCDNVKVLGEKLACVLFQLPPYLRLGIDRLTHFLNMLPAEIPCAFEFRHASWHCEEIFDLLRNHRHILCITDDGDFPLPDTTATGDLAYLRLRDEHYSDSALATYIERLKHSGAKQSFVFFKHEDAAAGPVLAARWLDLTNAARRTMAARPPQAVAAATPRTRGKKTKGNHL